MTVGDYIKRFAEKSNMPEYEQIEECLAYFGLQGTQELILEQAAKWIKLFYRRDRK